MYNWRAGVCHFRGCLLVGHYVIFLVNLDWLIIWFGLICTSCDCWFLQQIYFAL